MKKNIFTLLLTFIIMFIPTLVVNASDSFDAGECIEGFGSITLKETGSNNDVGGKIKIDNDTNLKEWNEKPVTFDADVQAHSKYKVDTVHYSIVSNEGVVCTGVVSGSEVEKNTGNVKLTFKIDKGNVKYVYVWGRDSKRSNPDKTDFISRETVKVYKNANANDKPANNSDISIAEMDREEVKDNCEKDLGYFIDKYWTWVLILMPTIAIILMTIDFVGAMLASDSDALKKASSKALKRVLALAILLLLPVIIRILFRLFDIDTCF